MKLFVRNCNEKEYQAFLKTIPSEYNFNNLSFFNIRKIFQFYDYKYDQAFLKFRFDIFRNWFKFNFRYSFSLTNKLDRILTLLKIKDHLTSYEEEFVLHAFSVMFAKERNLKKLLVPFNLQNNEYVYFKYKLVSLKIGNSNFNNGEIFISNKNITFYLDEKNFFTFNLNLLNNFEFNSKEIKFWNKQTTVTFSSIDNYVVYVSLLRIKRIFYA